MAEVAIAMLSLGAAAYYLYQRRKATIVVSKDSSLDTRPEIAQSAPLDPDPPSSVQAAEDLPNRTSAMLKSINKGRAKKTIKSNQNSLENLHVSGSENSLSAFQIETPAEPTVVDQEPKKVATPSKTVNRPPMQFDLGEMKLKQSLKKLAE